MPRKKVSKVSKEEVEAPIEEVVEESFYQEVEMEEEPAPRRIDWKRFFILITGFIVLMVIIWFAFGLNLSREEREQKANRKLIKEISEVMLLPEAETPVVATITDSQKLRNEQAFYKDAAEGDKLIIYQVSMRAILYRESEHKIINVGPIQPPPQAQ